MSNALLDNFLKNAANIAKNDLLKGFLPVLDNFLTAVQANQGGLAGVVAQANALPTALVAALPNAEAAVVKDEAAAVQTALHAEEGKLNQ